MRRQRTKKTMRRRRTRKIKKRRMKKQAVRKKMKRMAKMMTTMMIRMKIIKKVKVMKQLINPEINYFSTVFYTDIIYKTSKWVDR